VGNADGEQHGGVDFAGVGAFLFPVQILGSDGDIRTLGCGDGGIDAEIGWADDDFVAVVRLNQGKEIAKKGESGQAFCTSSSWRRSLFFLAI
jgi:hypothetical protein